MHRTAGHAHAACPWLVIWDDHEVQNDYAGLQAGDAGDSGAVIGERDFAARRAAAYQAFYEHMPLRRQRAFSGRTAGRLAPPMRLYGQVQTLDSLATL
jgi:alkaline phosphatase D